MYKKAAVIGLGDFLSGDFGAGGYVIEALEQASILDNGSCCFLGLEAWRTGLHTLGHQLACIVHAFSSGCYPAGTVRILDLPGYQQALRHSEACGSLGNEILNSLAKTAFSSSEPVTYRFVLIEAAGISGIQLSQPVRSAVRTTVRQISQLLAANHCHTRPQLNISRLYRLELLSAIV